MKNIWTYEEHILAFNLYCKIPFSKINANYPPVKELAKIINRSNSSVAMKLANFARLDPALKARNISGLTQGAKGEKIIWEKFNNDWEQLSLDYYTLLNTSQYPDVLLPIRVISPSRLSSTILFFIVLSESFSTSLNCPMVIYGSCIIASNVLWAIFGQSLGNISFILPHITQ